MKQTLILRIVLAIILIMHSVPGMFNDGVNNFGNLYLNKIGLQPFGLAIAWTVKLSHVFAAIAFLTDKYVKVAGIITIIILVAGIFMVHLPNGWFVVGGGTNGVEYNILLIATVFTVMYSDGKLRV